MVAPLRNSNIPDPAGWPGDGIDPVRESFIRQSGDPMATGAFPPNQSGTEVVFFDQFDGGQLDRSRWNVRVTGPVMNNEQQAYVESAETIYVLPAADAPGASGGGVLALHARYHPGDVTPEGNSFDFISGRIDTRERFDFLYGTVEARMRLPAGTGFWPAFWALGHSKWPETGEIDIMESVGEPDWVSAAVHGPGYSGETGLVNYHYLPAARDATDWHVYALEWSPDRMIFKVDGGLAYRVTAAMVGFHGRWAFADAKYLILNFALGGTYPFKINGVQTPYYGLPEATVELIRSGQARVLVDWVRVTRTAPAGG